MCAKTQYVDSEKKRENEIEYDEEEMKKVQKYIHCRTTEQ